jgi:hypothetical protein
MTTRKFGIDFKGYAEIEIDQEVIDQVDSEWRTTFYNLKTPTDIACHIGYNLIINQWRLSQLDGWANLDNDMAKVISDADWDAEAEELVEEK